VCWRTAGRQGSRQAQAAIEQCHAMTRSGWQAGRQAGELLVEGTRAGRPTCRREASSGRRAGNPVCLPAEMWSATRHCTTAVPGFAITTSMLCIAPGIILWCKGGEDDVVRLLVIHTVQICCSSAPS
jgi:hypothetical protein